MKRLFSFLRDKFFLKTADAALETEFLGYEAFTQLEVPHVLRTPYMTAGLQERKRAGQDKPVAM